MMSNSKYFILFIWIAELTVCLGDYENPGENIHMLNARRDHSTAVFASKFFMPGIIHEEKRIPEKNDDPCLEAGRWAQEVDTMVKTRSFLLARMAIIKAAAEDNLEHAVTFGKDTHGHIDYSPLSGGGQSTNGRVDMHWPGAFADLHNHPDNLPPSPGDYYGLIQIAHANPLYNTRVVCLADGKLYALIVFDQAAANTFIKQYPAVTAPGFSPKFPEPVISSFYEVRDAFILRGYSHREADSFGMAYILDRYDMGVLLLMQDDDVFKRMIVTETEKQGVKIYQQQYCK